MKSLTANELRQRYIDFFSKQYAHSAIPSSSVIPENDPTVLFTTAGMHPLVPYLMGEPHPSGKRLVDAQKCIRTDDIDEVGDASHCTFFEMMGNWSLGDYFKQEAIQMSFEFLTGSPDELGLGLDPKRLYTTVFRGDNDAPKDEESINHWKQQFATRNIDATEGIAGKDELLPKRPAYLRVRKRKLVGSRWSNWPMFPIRRCFISSDSDLVHDTKHGPTCHPNCDCGRFVEIWNDVFMQYNKMPRVRLNP